MKFAKYFVLGLSLLVGYSNFSYADITDFIELPDPNYIKPLKDSLFLSKLSSSALLNPNDVTLYCDYSAVRQSRLEGTTLMLKVKNVGIVELDGNGIYRDHRDDGATFCEDMAAWIQKKIDQAKATHRPLLYTPKMSAPSALTISKNLMYIPEN